MGSSSSLLSMIELPDVVQAIGQGRRSGALVVGNGKDVHRLFFDQGCVCAVVSDAPGSLYHGLVWTRIAPPQQFVRWGVKNAATMADLNLAQRLLKEGHIAQDAIRDAVDCCIEEAFTDILGWSDVSFNFQMDAEVSGWAAFQRDLGTRLAPNALLMESMRRQDELRRIDREMPRTWDMLVREGGFVEQLPQHAAAFLAAWRAERPVGAIIELSCLPPWQVKQALDWLMGADVLRMADGNELVVAADNARRNGQPRNAEGLYRRAVELGAGGGRVFQSLAELAQRRGDSERAARDYLRAAGEFEVTNPASAVLALRSALPLTENKEEPLRLLLGIYQRLEEQEECIDTLFQLAQYHEERDELDKSMVAVREAQQQGADPIRCSQVLAALAMLLQNEEEALVNLEVVVRLASGTDRAGEAMSARHQILLIQPGRCAIALEYARYLVANKDSDGAAETLANALEASERESTEQMEVEMRELLARLRPEDQANHAWLIKAYQSREDRAGASKQLEMMLQVQEQEGNHAGMAETLERMLQLGGDQQATLRRLARVQSVLERDRQARVSWIGCVRAARKAGDLVGARAACEEGLGLYSHDSDLHAMLADIANRQGQFDLAENHFRRAIFLARGAGDLAAAAELLGDLISLRPNDVVARRDLADVALDRGDPQSDHVLDEFIRFAVQAADIGLAIDGARKRVRHAERSDFAPRHELVELLRRAGRAQEELKEGQALVDDLVAANEYDQALSLVQSLVASHDQNADLLIQLASLYEALDDASNAVRFLRYAVPLLQREERTDRALEVLDDLGRMTADNPEIARARQLVEQGVMVNWAAIRGERALASKQRLVDSTGSGTPVES